MIHFKKMWEDVCNIIKSDTLEDIEIVEMFKTGFVVKTNEGTEIVTKDDFVDFWCKMLCLNEVNKSEISELGNPCEEYVFNLVKKLPYVNDNNGVITVSE
ncbi:hypothetical protein [Clostridium oceanicum]|uniref:Phage protein n=1 Tax=Clostridium oceanicum TaxID=1543 RepID=A0ABN1JHI4_9CLOT